MFLFLSPSTFLTCPLFYFSFSVSLLFFCFLFPSCLSFLLSFCYLVFVSFFHFLSSLLLFHEKNNIKIFNCNFFPEILSLVLVSFLFFVSKPFLLSLLFPDFKLCFLFNIKVFDFQTHNFKKKRNFWVKRGVATKRVFFINLCFEKCEKLWLFWGHFLEIFGWCSKNTVKIGVSAHFKRPKIEKRPFLMVNNWAALMVNNWATFVPLKNRQRGPVINH